MAINHLTEQDYELTSILESSKQQIKQLQQKVSSCYLKTYLAKHASSTKHGIKQRQSAVKNMDQIGADI